MNALRGVLRAVRAPATARLPPPRIAAVPQLQPQPVRLKHTRERGRNSRYPKAANHGARPCSRAKRREKKRKIIRRFRVTK